MGANYYVYVVHSDIIIPQNVDPVFNISQSKFVQKLFYNSQSPIEGNFP